jgi:hypothetical protein
VAPAVAQQPVTVPPVSGATSMFLIVRDLSGAREACRVGMLPGRTLPYLYVLAARSKKAAVGVGFSYSLERPLVLLRGK